MLVLSRKKTQRIVIDGPCVIEVVRTELNRVKLGITADPSVSIQREEILGEGHDTTNTDVELGGGNDGDAGNGVCERPTSRLQRTGPNASLPEQVRQGT